MILNYSKIMIDYIDDGGYKFTEYKNKFFCTKKEADIFWKNELEKVKPHLDSFGKIEKDFFGNTNIIYSDQQDYFDNRRDLEYFSRIIQKPESINIGKNKKEIASALESFSRAYFEA